MKTPVEERAAPAAAAFRVGPWRVEPALHRLERGGETVRVEPKVMEVLVHLAARPGAVVSREELQEAVWGTPYVSEDLPRRAVYELRKVLGDDARRPELIETIPRAGYRLVAPVVRLGPGEGGGDRAGEAAAATETAPPRWRRLAPPLALGLLAAAALSLGLLRGGHAPAAPSGFEVRPLTADPGLEYDPAFSPDGSRVAFLRTPDPRLNAAITLHVQLVGAESSLEVSEGPADFDHPIESPAWSPDGTAIAYRRWRREDGWGIYRVPALGGAERKLADLGRVGTSGLAWSPDGRWLAFGLRAGGDGPLALHRLDLETGARERLTRPPATIQGDQLPVWSPDGRRLAFVRTVDADASELRVVPAGGGWSRSLLPERHKIADVDWTPDGRRLVVAVSDGGRHRLWSVDAATGAVRSLSQLGDDTRWVTVATRGGRIVYGKARWRFGIRRYRLDTGESAAVPGLSSTFYDGALDLSPDGSRLALVSTRSGSFEVWSSDLEGRRPVQLTSFGGALVGQPRWLPDGRSIVFHAEPDGRSDLWTVAVGEAAPRALTGPPGDHRAPSLSRDGATIYFASSRSGDWQVWRMPAGGGPAERVTRQGGYLPQESADGAWLYYTRWQAAGLWRVPREGGPEERVLGDELAAADWGNWAPAREGIYFVTWADDGSAGLALYAPERGEVLRRIPLEGVPVQPSLTLAPEGDAAFLAELDRIESDLVLVEGAGLDGPDAPDR